MVAAGTAPPSSPTAMVTGGLGANLAATPGAIASGYGIAEAARRTIADRPQA